jgi:hypothetical protein
LALMFESFESAIMHIKKSEKNHVIVFNLAWFEKKVFFLIIIIIIYFILIFFLILSLKIWFLYKLWSLLFFIIVIYFFLIIFLIENIYLSYLVSILLIAIYFYFK